MSKLFNPDYLVHLCQKYNLRPSSKYGQNFLIDPEPIEIMLEVAEVSKEDTIVEIGPGFGVLTFALAKQAKQVVSFEIEKKLEKYWIDAKPENVKIIWGNALRNPKSEIRNQKYKVIANLPYQITSPIIRIFLESDNPPEVMVLMVQKEVAERICSRPGQMSLLSVAVQYYAETEIIMNVPRVYFWPEPRVDSAVIKIKNVKRPPTGEAGKAQNKKEEEFFEVVKAGFSQKRKFLIKNLLPLVGKQKKGLLNGVFEQVGVPLTARAQELSVEQWIDLAKLVKLCYNTGQ